MTIVNRLSRLLQADLHAVLDSIEEPYAVLKQAVREMEEELARSTQRVKSLGNECESLLQRETEIEQSIARIDEELGICFEAENESLARPLIKRKLELQRFLKSISKKRETTQKQHTEVQAQLEENRTRFESMRQKSEILAEEYASNSKRHDDDFTWTAPDLMVADDEVEVALLREKKLRAQQLRESSS
ncbi:MAG: PspA/IM30 family protein [Gammaproteobacteria bacterium]|nr:PspA/IM30 family protein [Gammaproteobacteria bacterium]